MGSVFKSIGKAISGVVKGVTKIVKKVWKPLLIAAAIYFGGAFLIQTMFPSMAAASGASAFSIGGAGSIWGNAITTVVGGAVKAVSAVLKLGPTAQASGIPAATAQAAMGANAFAPITGEAIAAGTTAGTGGGLGSFLSSTGGAAAINLAGGMIKGYAAGKAKEESIAHRGNVIGSGKHSADYQTALQEYADSKDGVVGEKDPDVAVASAINPATNKVKAPAAATPIPIQPGQQVQTPSVDPITTPSVGGISVPAPQVESFLPPGGG